MAKRNRYVSDHVLLSLSQTDADESLEKGWITQEDWERHRELHREEEFLDEMRRMEEDEDPFWEE